MHMFCSMDQNRTNFGSAFKSSTYLKQKGKGGSIYSMCASPMIQNDLNLKTFSVLKNHTPANMIKRNYSNMGNTHSQLPMALFLAPDVSHDKHLAENNNLLWECNSDVIGNSFTKIIKNVVTTMLRPIMGIMEYWKSNEVHSLDTFSDFEMDYTFDEEKQKLTVEPSTTKLRDYNTTENKQFSTTSTTNVSESRLDNCNIKEKTINMSVSGENLKTPEENTINKMLLPSNINSNHNQSQVNENTRYKLDKRRNKRKNRKTKNKILETLNCNNNNNKSNVKPGISTSSFNPCNFFHKSRIMNKNKKEKVRQEIELNIHDDIDVDETDYVITPGISTSNNDNNVNQINDNIYSPVSGCLSNNFISCSPKFTYNDFPTIPAPKKTHTNNCNINNNNSKSDLNKKDCNYYHPTSNNLYKYTENEDISMFFCISEEPTKQLIEFVENKAQIPITKSYDIVPSSCIIKNIPRRIRQISECSDDSYICFESDDTLAGDRGCTWSDVEDHDDDDDDDDDEDDDDGDVITQIDLDSNNVDSEDEEDITTTDTEDTEIESIGTNQPDSGFEEKTFKVRFNLNPKVHVMRTWNFAYRQARIGLWEQYGRDRVRFHDKIKSLEPEINLVLTPAHRDKIFSERFSSEKEINC